MRNKRMSKSELRHADAVAHTPMNNKARPNSMSRYYSSHGDRSELGFNYHKKGKKRK